MKTIFILLCFAAFSIAEQYTDRYDNINIEEILSNKRLLSSYIKCLLEKGRCTPEGIELKGHIKDAMQTGCSKCTEKQKSGARKVVRFIKEKEPNSYKDLLQKYDPNDEFKEIYEAFLQQQN